MSRGCSCAGDDAVGLEQLRIRWNRRPPRGGIECGECARAGSRHGRRALADDLIGRAAEGRLAAGGAGVGPRLGAGVRRRRLEPCLGQSAIGEAAVVPSDRSGCPAGRPDTGCWVCGSGASRSGGVGWGRRGRWWRRGCRPGLVSWARVCADLQQCAELGSFGGGRATGRVRRRR
jgi:hypothetical protein